MLKELKKNAISITITLTTMLLALTTAWANINSRVEAHEAKLQEAVSQTEFRAIMNGQERIQTDMRLRFDRIESRLERLQERK
jgi:head-tail adaptor